MSSADASNGRWYLIQTDLQCQPTSADTAGVGGGCACSQCDGALIVKPHWRMGAGLLIISGEERPYLAAISEHGKRQMRGRETAPCESVHQGRRDLSFSAIHPPPFRAGDEWRSGSPCATLPAYRRACGNRRLWSGTDNQGSNERVSRSQRFAFGRACLVRCVQPRNPLPLGMGRGQRSTGRPIGEWCRHVRGSRTCLAVTGTGLNIP
jgi:hypothetical protein